MSTTRTLRAVLAFFALRCATSAPAQEQEDIKSAAQLSASGD